MNKEMNTEAEIIKLVEAAALGDKRSLETLVAGAQDMVFNLSLRMLGTIPDAEDATQEILVRIISNLSSFRKDGFPNYKSTITAGKLIDSVVQASPFRKIQQF